MRRSSNYDYIYVAWIALMIILITSCQVSTPSVISPQNDSSLLPISTAFDGDRLLTGDDAEAFLQKMTSAEFSIKDYPKTYGNKIDTNNISRPLIIYQHLAATIGYFEAQFGMPATETITQNSNAPFVSTSWIILVREKITLPNGKVIATKLEAAFSVDLFDSFHRQISTGNYFFHSTDGVHFTLGARNGGVATTQYYYSGPSSDPNKSCNGIPAPDWLSFVSSSTNAVGGSITLDEYHQEAVVQFNMQYFGTQRNSGNDKCELYYASSGTGSWSSNFKVYLPFIKQGPPPQPQLTLDLSISPDEVKPLKDGQTSASLASTTTAHVLVKEATTGNPVAGKQVKLEAKAVAGSGGHIHTANRPDGIFLASGSNILTATTNGNGEVVATYRTSGFGGEEKITASLVSDPGIQDASTVKVKVSGLVELPAGNNYTLTGAKAGKHTQNHFAKPTMVNALIAFANTYEKTLPNAVKPCFNDMSLPWGGPFEYKGNWNLFQKHLEHREGKSADFPLVCVPGKQSDKDKIDKMMRAKSLKPYHEDQFHWHLRIK